MEVVACVAIQCYEIISVFVLHLTNYTLFHGLMSLGRKLGPCKTRENILRSGTPASSILHKHSGTAAAYTEKNGQQAENYNQYYIVNDIAESNSKDQKELESIELQAADCHIGEDILSDEDSKSEN